LRQPPEGGQPVIRVPLIRIVGAGIMPSRDLSLGALNALRAAGCVAYVHWIGPADFLPSLGIEEIRNLSALYHDAGVDRDNYGRVQDAVIALAIEFGDVAYLVPGNPGLGDTLTHGLADRARQIDDIEVTLVPGISSFDTVMGDLARDFLERGCAVVDANRLLLFNYTVDDRLDLLIYHGSSVGTSQTHFRRPWDHNRVDLLQAWLLQSRGPEAPYFAICSAPSLQETPRIHTGLVSEMQEKVEDFDYGTSIYVPGRVDLANKDVDHGFLHLLVGSDL
jgi:hypothetical protein